MPPRRWWRAGSKGLPTRILHRGRSEPGIPGSRSRRKTLPRLALGRVLAARNVPIWALALRTDGGVLRLVAREPFVPAAVAPIAREFHLRHTCSIYPLVPYRQCPPNRLTLALPCGIFLLGIYERVGEWKHGNSADSKSQPPRNSKSRGKSGSSVRYRKRDLRRGPHRIRRGDLHMSGLRTPSGAVQARLRGRVYDPPRDHDQGRHRDAKRSRTARSGTPTTPRSATKRGTLPNCFTTCARVIDNPIQKRGRPRLPLSDAIFCAAMKVYVGMSARRTDSTCGVCRARIHRQGAALQFGAERSGKSRLNADSEAND